MINREFQNLVHGGNLPVPAIESPTASHTGEIGEEYWAAENQRLHEELKAYMDGLELEAAFAASQAMSPPRIQQDQIALRKFGWVPDTSEETRTARGPRLRAVYGAAVLLAPSLRESSDHSIEDAATEGLYALSLAVDQAEGLTFYKMIALGRGDKSGPLSLYRALTGDAYKKIMEAKRREERAIMRRFALANVCAVTFETVGGETVMIDDREAKAAFCREEATLDELIHATYRLKVRELETVPRQSENTETTAKVTNLLLTSSRRTYGGSLQGLVDGGPGCRILDHIFFRKELETYLAQSQLIRAAA